MQRVNCNRRTDRQTEAWGHCFSMNDRKKRTAQHNREKVALEMSEGKKEREREREKRESERASRRSYKLLIC